MDPWIFMYLFIVYVLNLTLIELSFWWRSNCLIMVIQNQFLFTYSWSTHFFHFHLVSGHPAGFCKNKLQSWLLIRFLVWQILCSKRTLLAKRYCSYTFVIWMQFRHCVADSCRICHICHWQHLSGDWLASGNVQRTGAYNCHIA